VLPLDEKMPAWKIGSAGEIRRPSSAPARRIVSRRPLPRSAPLFLTMLENVSVAPLMLASMVPLLRTTAVTVAEP